MNIKSLLLGSAAAMVAVSGARAADAIIAEPEPVEYVRVCDVYGAGFFYIPGTETCLRISGYVWYQIGASGFDDPLVDTPAYVGGSTIADGWLKTTRARVNFDARSETEWGTLRGFIRYQANWGSPGTGPFSDGPVGADQAFFELGGFYGGYTESAWAATLNGGASNWGSHSWGGMYYGYAQRHQIGYNFTGGNGFFGTISLEDDALAGDGYMPDVVAKLGVNQGWGSAWVKAGYQDAINPLGDDGWGVGAGVQINVPNAPGSSLRVLGYYADSDTRFSSGSPYTSPEWSVLASYNHQFTPELGVSVAAQYFADLYVPGTDLSSGADGWGAELSVVWTPVTNFEVRTELHYDDVDAPIAEGVSADRDGTFSGFLRFTRYF
jgi:hypothetical protein